MASANNPKKKPLGDSIRDMIKPALADDRREQIQLRILNNVFEDLVEQIPALMEESLSDIFTQAATQRPSEKNPFIISVLTTVDRRTGRPKYSPIMLAPLPISTSFTEFTADKIKKLPGYIQLHAMARKENISLRLSGLTLDEAKASGGMIPPILVIDGSKSYEDGALENAQFYPNLPEPKVEFDRVTPREFRL